MEGVALRTLGARERRCNPRPSALPVSIDGVDVRWDRLTKGTERRDRRLGGPVRAQPGRR